MLSFVIVPLDLLILQIILVVLNNILFYLASRFFFYFLFFFKIIFRSDRPTEIFAKGLDKEVEEGELKTFKSTLSNGKFYLFYVLFF
jgi:hypothetical protein